MNWLGKWQNQYGSVLEITEVAGHKITGQFKTALTDSGFYGQAIEMTGYVQGNCVGLSGGGKTAAGDMLVTYTGLLRGGELETLWYVVADAALVASKEGQPTQIRENNWWRAITTNADTFELIPD